jgi:hypothetical protein
MKEKKRKDGTIKEKKKTKEDGFSTLKKSVKAQTIWISTFSFEVGYLSASPTKPTLSKEHSILPSMMCLLRMRGGSTASALRFNAASSQISTGAPHNPATVVNALPLSVSQSSRLSVENVNPVCLASVASSNKSSLRHVNYVI